MWLVWNGGGLATTDSTRTAPARRPYTPDKEGSATTLVERAAEDRFDVSSGAIAPLDPGAPAFNGISGLYQDTQDALTLTIKSRGALGVPDIP
jgi:hypothetical protein